MPNFEYSSRLFSLAVLKCASLCVQRGQQKKYTPFWNENLQKLKKDRDEARKLARKTGLNKDCITLLGTYARVSNYKPNLKILKNDLKPQQNNNSADFQQLFNEDFNLEELRNGISTLVKGKSAGPDGILPEFLINLGDSAKMTLLAFINQTWENGLPSA
ncbi:hypothetical protein TNCT_659791 [Trichonephila clavata]|uniref:Reverse transcriptase n=1 Tax=Trichonephila clavata TaxID=2740835 RepID=A0A8X6K9Z6_TRICU|nr:hypothetical protein TNCT_659791 [Trichonephila clavata]